MRHPRLDIRGIHGADVADGTRAILIEHQGELIARLPPLQLEGRRAYMRSPEAQERRRHRGTRQPT